MTHEQLSQLVTLKDLMQLHQTFISNIKEILVDKATSQKEFYSVKEFVARTGMKYSTVLYHCKVGNLKARQDGANCAWQIHASEIKRFRKEAEENAGESIDEFGFNKNTN